MDTGKLAKFERETAKLIAKVWSDSVFCKRFLQDPMAVLQDAGLLITGLSIVLVSTGQSATAMMSKQETPEGITYTISLPSEPNSLMDEKVSESNFTFPIRPSSC